MTQYWGGGGGTRQFFLLTLYKFKNIGGVGVGGHVPPPPPLPPTPPSLTDMLHKLLLSVGIGCNFFNIIKNMYSKTRCSIKLNSIITGTFNYNRGVRQGCVLMTCLCGLTVKKLILFLLPDETRLSCLLYADHLVLLSHSQQSLQMRFT